MCMHTDIAIFVSMYTYTYFTSVCIGMHADMYVYIQTQSFVACFGTRSLPPPCTLGILSSWWYLLVLANFFLVVSGTGGSNTLEHPMSDGG